MLDVLSTSPAIAVLILSLAQRNYAQRTNAAQLLRTHPASILVNCSGVDDASLELAVVGVTVEEEEGVLTSMSVSIILTLPVDLLLLHLLHAPASAPASRGLLLILLLVLLPLLLLM